jgi:hypothetical protein
VLPVFQMCSAYPALYTTEPDAANSHAWSADVAACKYLKVPWTAPDLVTLSLKAELSPTVSTVRPVFVLLLKLDETRS